jgi:hypothetical protein
MPVNNAESRSALPSQLANHESTVIKLAQDDTQSDIVPG